MRQKFAFLRYTRAELGLLSLVLLVSAATAHALTGEPTPGAPTATSEGPPWMTWPTSW